MFLDDEMMELQLQLLERDEKRQERVYNNLHDYLTGLQEIQQMESSRTQLEMFVCMLQSMCQHSFLNQQLPLHQPLNSTINTLAQHIPYSNLNNNILFQSAIAILKQKVFFAQYFQRDKLLSIDKQLSTVIKQQQQQINKNNYKPKKQEGLAQKKDLNNILIRQFTQQAITLSLRLGKFKAQLREELQDQYISDDQDYSVHI